jgi:flagellar basal-body rod protein FlgB
MASGGGSVGAAGKDGTPTRNSLCVEWKLHCGVARDMPIGLFDAVSAGLARALSLQQRRHEILASNIANVETPGYRARDLEFGDALASAFDAAGTGEAGFVASEPRLVDRPSGSMRPDGNTVDIDMEMARLAYNRSSYTTYAEILARRLGALRRAIEGAE